MRLPVHLILLLLLGLVTAFRGNSNRGSAPISNSQSNQLNIGLIAPHTNFGKSSNKKDPRIMQQSQALGVM